MAKEKTIERKRLVVLDTHAILHRAFHALPDFSSSKGEPTGALYGVISNMIQATCHPAPFFACGSAEDESPELVRRSFSHSQGE